MALTDSDGPGSECECGRAFGDCATFDDGGTTHRDRWTPAPPPIVATADPERGPRLDAERVTLEFASRSAKRADCGRLPMSDSPLFGGSAQGDLFA